MTKKTTSPASYLSEQRAYNWNDADDYLAGLETAAKNAPKPSSAIRRAGDYGITAVKAAMSLPEAAVGIADMVTGGHAGKLANDLGFKPAEARAALDELYSPEQKAANQKVAEADGFMGTAAAMLQNPSTIAHAVVESAPSLLPAGAVARGVMKVAPKVGGAVAAGIGEGVVSAGQTAEQVRQQSEDGLLSAGQAGLAAGSGALTGLLGAVAGKVANRLGIGDVNQLVAGVRNAGPEAQKNVARKMMEGFATEGILQELPQSAQEQVAQNLALGRPWDEGVGKAAAMGALAGGVMGAAAAPMGRAPTAAPPVVPTPADEVRAMKMPESGPLTKGANASIEAHAVALESAAETATRLLQPDPPTNYEVPNVPKVETALGAATPTPEGSIEFEPTAVVPETDGLALMEPGQLQMEAPSQEIPANSIEFTAPEPQGPLALTFDDAPTGVLVADDTGEVRPQTRGEAISQSQELQRKAELGLTPDVERASMRAAMGNVTRPGDLLAAGDVPFRSRKSAQSRVARAGDGYEVVEIAPDSFVGRRPAVEATVVEPAPADAVSGPEDAPGSMQAEVAPLEVAPGAEAAPEIRGDDGRPFMSKQVARRRASLNPGYVPAEADGGWVLRRDEGPAPSPQTQQPDEVAPNTTESGGDISGADGKPFKSKAIATRKANMNPGYSVAQVDGGWVARRSAPAAQESAPTPAAAATETTAARPVEAAPAARVVARVGRTPNAAVPLELRANADGSLSAYLEGHELLDYDSGDPIKLPAGVTDEDAKKAIRAAGAVSERQNFFKPSDIVLSRDGDDGMGGSTSADDLKAALGPVVSGWKYGPKGGVQIVQSVQDLPGKIVESLKSQEALHSVRGMFVPKSQTVYLIADKLKSVRDAEFVLFHEVLGHMGLRAFLGKNYADTMIRMQAANRGLQREADQWFLANGQAEVEARIATGQSRSAAMREVALLAVEEALADRAGNNPKFSSWNFLLAQIQKGLRALGLDNVANWMEGKTSAEVFSLLNEARKAIKDGVLDVDGGNGASGEPAAGLAARTQAERDVPVLSRDGEVPAWVKDGPKALQSAASKVDTYRPKEGLKDKLAGFREKWQTRLVQGIADSFAPLKELDYDAYVAARMSKSGDGVLEGTLLHGIPKMDADGAISGELDGKGFLGALQELNGEHDRFLMWLAGNRSDALAKEGRENLFSTNEIAAMKDLNKGTMADGKSRTDAYRKAAQTFQAYNNAVLDIAEKSGLIDAEGRQAWQSDFYVPFYRLNQDETTAGPSKIKGLVRQKGIQKLKGGTEPLGDLLENTLRNWSNLISGSLANTAARKSLLAAEKVGVALETKDDAARDMAKSLGKKGSATYFMDQGQQRWFVVDDPFVLDAITAMEPVGMGAAMKAMGAFKKWLTFGVTVNPAFKVRNLIRDSVSAIAQGDLDYNIAKNLKEGWKATDKRSETYGQMLFSGAMMRFGTSFEGNQAAAAKRIIEGGIKRETILDSPSKFNAAWRLWDEYQELGDRTENVNRAALYQKLIAEGKSPQQAAFEARDLMDFGLQGAWPAVRFLSQTVPFLNARIQGLYKLGRAAKQDPRRMGYVVGATALASIALMLAYQDDEDWKAREDWDRDAYWWFKVGDTAYRIPKPFEIGAMGTIVERTLELMIDDEMNGARFAQRLRAMVGDTFSLNPVPQAVRPLLELWANKDSFTGRDIESQGMERHTKAERYDSNTSMVARTLGKATGEVGMSPAQLDAVIKGYLGWVGTFSVAAVDRLADAFGVFPSELPALRSDEWSGGFVKSLPAAQSRYSSEFWSESRELSMLMADIKRARDIGDFEAAREKAEANADKLAAVPIYRQAERQMQLLTKQIKVIGESTSLSSKEKRDALTKLTTMKHDLTRDARRRRIALQGVDDEDDEE